LWIQKEKMSEIPPSKAKVRDDAAERFAGFVKCGIPYWGILPSPNSGETCAAALAINGKGFALGEFQSLPLPECDQEYCRCCIIASKSAEWEPLKIP
jgi:hypothetical protein